MGNAEKSAGSQTSAPLSARSRMCRSQLSGGKHSGDKRQEFLEISWAIFDVLSRSHIWNEAGLKAGGSGLGWGATDNLHTCTFVMHLSRLTQTPTLTLTLTFTTMS